MIATSTAGSYPRRRRRPRERGYRWPVADAVTNALELAVGVACLAAAVGLRRTAGVGWLVVALAVAGIAACAHAAWSLST
jgi:hypothetical protein